MGAFANPYILAAVLVVSLGYAGVEAIKKPVEKVNHKICHVVTLGHKCKVVDKKP
jgi:hypothetical protein